MYRVYIETEMESEYKMQMEELAMLIAKELLRTDNIIVYVNGKDLSRDENIDININAYVKLQSSNGEGGLEVTLNELSKVSNGLAKEIYKEIIKIYYDKNYNKGVTYVKEKIGIKDVPSVILNLFSTLNINELNWFKNNNVLIARAISTGIKTSFTLKQC